MTQTQKRNWTQELSKSASRPGNPRPNAEEILDAGIIKIRVQTCKFASSGTERKDQVRVLKTKTCEKFLSTWTQAPDLSKSAPDGTERGTERKDQIRVLQTITASESFTIRNTLSERSEVQSPLASGHQTRASVINTGYQLQDCVQDRV